MKTVFKSTQFKLAAFVIVLLIFSACAVTGGNGNTPADTPQVDNPPAQPQPVVEEPTAQPVEDQDEQPAEDPAPQTVSDEPLNNTRLIPALKEIMLRPADLIISYTLDNDKEVINDRMINQITWGDGREYYGTTGRITGWNTYMERTLNEFGPYSYRTRIEVFKTVEGAQLAFSDEWLFIFNDPALVITEYLDLACAYGNECVLAFHEENVPGTTDFNVEYHLVFRYRNTIVYVFAKGLEGTTTEETVFEVADLMIDRLNMYQ